MVQTSKIFTVVSSPPPPPPTPISQWRAVNFMDKRLTNREKIGPIVNPPSSSTLYQRLAEVKAHKFNVIRVPYFYEGYTADPSGFVAGLREVATAADQLGGLQVVYDFHQFHVGSHFPSGTGFPSFLTGQYSPDSAGILAFWRDYLNNNIFHNGVRVWDLHANLIRDVVIRNVDANVSTAGYEILNEPLVANDCSEYGKVGELHTYIGTKLREATTKTIFFDRAENLGACLWAYLGLGPLYDRQIAPRGVSNLIFAPHFYRKVSVSNDELIYLKQLANDWQPGMPVFAGEWGQIPPDVVTQSVVDNYTSAFKNNYIGWAYWCWDPVWPYACKDQSYANTKYLGFLYNALSSSLSLATMS
jgi:hypothetical protein